MDKYIHLNSFVEKEGYIYISDKDMNALYRKGLNDGELEFLGSFPDEASSREDLHGQLFLINEKVLFSSMNATNLHVYDIKNDKFLVFTIPDYEVKEWSYISMTVVNNKAYFFPHNAEKMMIIELSKVIENKNNDNQTIDRLYIKLIDINIRVNHAFCLWNNYIYLASEDKKDNILRIDTNTDEIDYYSIDKINNGFNYIICIDEENLLLASSSENLIYKYNIKEGKIHVLFEGGKGNVIGFADCGDAIYTLFSDIKSSVIIYKRNIEIKKFVFIQDEVGKEALYYRYLGKLSDGRLVIASRYDQPCTMMIVDPFGRSFRRIEISRNEIKRGFARFSLELEEHMKEMFADDLENYLRALYT